MLGRDEYRLRNICVCLQPEAPCNTVWFGSCTVTGKDVQTQEDRWERQHLGLVGAGFREKGVVSEFWIVYIHLLVDVWKTFKI